MGFGLLVRSLGSEGGLCPLIESWGFRALSFVFGFVPFSPGLGFRSLSFVGCCGRVVGFGGFRV